MRRQKGVSTIAVALIAMVAVAGVGFFTWQQMGEVQRLQAELKKASQELAAVSRETSQLKIAAERLATERDSVRKVMEDQQAASVQMHADLALAKDQISYLTARTSKDVVKGMPKSPR